MQAVCVEAPESRSRTSESTVDERIRALRESGAVQLIDGGTERNQWIQWVQWGQGG